MHLSLYLYQHTSIGVMSTECCVCTFLENTNILPNEFPLTTTKPPSLFFRGNNLKANPKNHIISPLNTSAHVISN